MDGNTGKDYKSVQQQQNFIYTQVQTSGIIFGTHIQATVCVHRSAANTGLDGQNSTTNAGPDSPNTTGIICGSKKAVAGKQTRSIMSIALYIQQAASDYTATKRLPTQNNIYVTLGLQSWWQENIKVSTVQSTNERQ